MSDARHRCAAAVLFTDPQLRIPAERQCSYAAVAERRPHLGMGFGPAAYAANRPMPVCRRHREARRVERFSGDIAQFTGVA